MKFACSFLLVLISLTASSALFWAGNVKPNSRELIRKSENWNFQGSKCRYIHFNTCREHNLIVHRVEVKPVSGNNILGKVVHGGEEDFYIVVELCGAGWTSYETTIWGHFRPQPYQTAGGHQQQYVSVENAYMLFDQFWPCRNPVKLY